MKKRKNGEKVRFDRVFSDFFGSGNRQVHSLKLTAKAPEGIT